MLVRNAVHVLSPHAKVEVARRRYTATIRKTVIEFRDVRGQVTDLRCRRGADAWRPKTLTEAVRDALRKVRNISGPDGHNLLLNVCLDHRGPTFAPVACVILMAFEPLDGAAAEWTDLDAIVMAEGVVAGKVADGVLLDWLVGRGSELGRLVNRERTRPISTSR